MCHPCLSSKGMNLTCSVTVHRDATPICWITPESSPYQHCVGEVKWGETKQGDWEGLENTGVADCSDTWTQGEEVVRTGPHFKAENLRLAESNFIKINGLILTAHLWGAPLSLFYRYQTKGKQSTYLARLTLGASVKYSLCRKCWPSVEARQNYQFICWYNPDHMKLLLNLMVSDIWKNLSLSNW